MPTWRSGQRRTPRRSSSCPTRAGEAGGQPRHRSFGLVQMSATVVQVIVGGLLLGAVYALFSSGLTLIWGMMNVVNFAHGDFVMLAMYTAFVVWQLLGMGPAAGVPIAALVLATVGIASYFALVRHVMRGPMIAQILGHLRLGAAAALLRVLGLRREFPVA